MKITLQQIQLTNFKNYARADITCSSGINCLVGKNGMGKTNLLDAIYYLCMTKSHFSLTDPYLVRHEQDFFRLSGQFKTPYAQKKIVAKYQLRKKKVFEANQVAYTRLADHIGELPIVMVAPDDTQLATDGSETRRKFIDNTLSQIDPEYLQKLMVYNKLLKQRNALLKKMGEEKKFQAALIATYNQQMVEPARFIFEKRTEFARVLQPVFQVMYKYISNESETVQLGYKSPLQTKDMAEILRDNQEKDRILQRTTSGIHRDDLTFEIENRPLKKFASQGQLKSYILALKLSQYEILREFKEVEPILLLDDIFDKLDQYRVFQLLELLITGKFGQVFLSDTNVNRVAKTLEKLDAEHKQFLVKEGSIEELAVE
ncbi:MAG TPA: DNA replication and repair protein RecF [Saprospiraceae bacterium]|nr:DNA replication and repair protein RecF [Saprospiraceae bacterium]